MQTNSLCAVILTRIFTSGGEAIRKLSTIVKQPPVECSPRVTVYPVLYIGRQLDGSSRFEVDVVLTTDQGKTTVESHATTLSALQTQRMLHDSLRGLVKTGPQ